MSQNRQESRLPHQSRLSTHVRSGNEEGGDAGFKSASGGSTTAPASFVLLARNEAQLDVVGRYVGAREDPRQAGVETVLNLQEGLQRTKYNNKSSTSSVN